MAYTRATLVVYLLLQLRPGLAARSHVGSYGQVDAEVEDEVPGMPAGMEHLERVFSEDMERVPTNEVDAYADVHVHNRIVALIPDSPEEAGELGEFVAHASLELVEQHVLNTAANIHHVFHISLATAHIIHAAMSGVSVVMSFYGLVHMMEELANGTDIDHMSLGSMNVDPQKAGVCEHPSSGESKLVVEMAEQTVAGLMRRLVQDNFLALANRDQERAASVLHLFLANIALRQAALPTAGWQSSVGHAYVKCVLAILIKASTQQSYRVPDVFGNTEDEKRQIGLVHSNVLGLLLGKYDSIGCCSGEKEVAMPLIFNKPKYCKRVRHGCRRDVESFHRDAVCVKDQCLVPYEGGVLLQALSKIVRDMAVGADLEADFAA